MKHLLLFSLLLSSIFFVACDPGGGSSEEGTYADKASYATMNIVESLEDADKDRYILQLDNGLKFFLVSNYVETSYEPKDQQRVVIYYSVIEDYTSEGDPTLEGAAYGCDYGLRLFTIYDVHTTQNVVVSTQEEDDAYPDHAISYIYDNMTYANKYINMLAGLRTDDLDGVNFYLVENTFENPKESKEGYLNLELRYDRGTDESYGLTYDEFVSIDISDFDEKLEGMEGILLRVITLNSGTIYISVDTQSTEESSVSLTSRSSNAKKF